MKNWPHFFIIRSFRFLLFFGFIACDNADMSSRIEASGYENTSVDTYKPDNNPATYDENPDNLPLSQVRTYQNVDNIEVQSPTEYKAIPPEASAICRDGTYSFSKHRQGTCSHHGGVAKWLTN